MAFSCTTLDEFLSGYGDLLAEKARRTLAPLHVPSRDKVRDLGLLRQPYEAQKHVIEACIKNLGRMKADKISAEMGSGKTIMACGVVHGYGMSRYANRAKYWFGPRGEAHDVKAYGPYVEVTHDFMVNTIRPSSTNVDESAKRKGLVRIQPFAYRGKRYVCDGGCDHGTPGVTPVWNNRATCWEVTPAAEYKGKTVDRSGYHASSPHRAGIEAGAVGMKVKATGKKGEEWVMHSPRMFRNVCKGSYRALIVCPTTLVDKWVREVQKTVPNAVVYVIESHAQLLALARQHAERRRKFNVGKDEHNRRYRELLPLSRNMVKWGESQFKLHQSGQGHLADENVRIMAEGLRTRASCYDTCEGYEYYVIGKDKLKLGSSWRHAYQKDSEARGGRYRCPRCGVALAKKSSREAVTDDYFKKGACRKQCHKCHEQLWQDLAKPARYSPAKIIQSKLGGFWDIAVFDEAHEYKGDDSLQGDAMGLVASAVRKCIALTGTIVGGYAWHVRCAEYRLGTAHTLIEAGHEWGGKKAFDEAYGRIELKVKYKAGNEPVESGKGMTYGRTTKGVTTTSYTRPGIMPTLFRHLMSSCVFLSLAEVADNLPVLDEEPIEVDMDDEQREAYDKVDADITDAIKDMFRKGGKKALGAMLNCLLCYPDYPYDWGPIGYYEEDKDSLTGMGEKRWVTVTVPENIDPTVMRPKEKAAVEWCLAERDAGRQAWVYAVYTDKRDCIARLERFMKAAGLRVAVMRASVPPREREAWIDTHGKEHDVIISHPQLVQTGLDFFNPATGHNYCSILFYQTGYSLFTLRQASRRAWRIGQKKPCKVAYLSYSDSMQTRALALMGKKLAAAQALEGNFSSEGLAAMAGDDSNIEMALAKSLADNIREDDGARAWKKVTTGLEVKRKASAAKRKPTVIDDDLFDDDDVKADVGNLVAAVGSEQATGFMARLLADLAKVGVSV